MGDIISNITDTVESTNGTITNFVNDINAYQFGTDNIINKAIGTFRYLVGEPVFMTFVFLISVSLGFLLFKLIVKLFKVVTSLIPGFGKIKLN